jgi:hypothetical protein
VGFCLIFLIYAPLAYITTSTFLKDLIKQIMGTFKNYILWMKFYVQYFHIMVERIMSVLSPKHPHSNPLKLKTHDFTWQRGFTDEIKFRALRGEAILYYLDGSDFSTVLDTEQLSWLCSEQIGLWKDGHLLAVKVKEEESLGM